MITLTQGEHTLKRLIFDTNVLLDDPIALRRHAPLADELIIPLCVLEELDALKLEQSERGQRARAITHELDTLSAAHPELSQGISFEGAVLKVSDLGHKAQEGQESQESRHDLKLLACLKAYHQLTFEQSTLLTRDVNLRVRARFYGLNATPDLLARSSEPSSHDHSTLDEQGELSDQRVRLEHLTLSDEPAWGLRPLNNEQRLALHYLRDPSVSLVCLTGKAGTGKTLIALAAGLAQCLEGERRYERLLVSRAIFPLGRDIGYLPGTLEEKMSPWVQPIYDNLDFLLGQRPQRQPHRGRARADELLDMGVVEVTPITYIRGRSIPGQYMIIDEAQNLTQHEVKTILTRAGQGTKLVLIGDTAQIDHPYLSAEHNGLKHVIERFKGQSCAAHVLLTQGERSPLAALAADLL